MAGCDLNALSQTTQPWNRLDPKVILAIQCGLMCDALNGVDPTTETNPITLQERLNCFAVLSEAQLMGIWTLLWSEFLKIIQDATAGGQIRNFVNDPNMEGITPANQSQPAFAYPVGGGTEWQWVVPSGPWV